MRREYHTAAICRYPIKTLSLNASHYTKRPQGVFVSHHKNLQRWHRLFTGNAIMMSICFGFRKRGHAGESSSRLMGPNCKPHICPKRMEQRRKMVYRNKRPRPSRRSSLQRFRCTLSTWKQENLRFIKLPMSRQTRIHRRCSCVLTVRKTDASSRTTEYTSPLLLIKTCVGRKKKQ